MRKQLALTMFAIVALAACDSSSSGGLGTPEIAGNDWDVPESYEFKVKSSCGERSLIGLFRIVVQNGYVAEAEGLDESGKALFKSGLGESIPTLEGLLEEAVEAQQVNADVLQVEFDPSDGHPTRINIDYNKDATDDEACYVITEYSAS